MSQNHPFHLVTYSPWPLLGSLATLSFMMSMINLFYNFNYMFMFYNFLIILMIMFQWWRDVTRESTFQGFHTFKVVLGLRMGMILFIVSEIFFFVSFFWSYFHASLTPSSEIGLIWPPTSIQPFNPSMIPLLNTLILLTSGLTVTWAHHALMESNFNEAFYGLIITIILGGYFSFLQGIEYLEASFNISDSSYGSSFFMATGFHGLHVLIGTIFLSACLSRLYFNHFSPIHHFGFEAAAWYWHFVDVVWLFLYISIYWWGS
uniref:Cytochrome c oxidase subunit 3 n=1 Tax=Rodolia quadrimaculata TaxID=2678939 RepID=A0A6B9MXD1_9CUCU|nr:cytochrome c oxidase subunit III [Rodolia quadrimaculata]